MEFSPELILLLLCTGVFAGIVDAAAGGGGLISLPVLLATGLGPLEALACNKLQGCTGTFTSSLNFMLRGQVRFKEAGLSFVCALAGGGAGTLAVQYFAAPWLEDLLPLLLIGFALYFLLSPRVGDVSAKQRVSYPLFALCAGFGVGFYDGFFGPGAGSFYALAFVVLLGYQLRSATAHSKVLNLASNIASLTFFGLAGHIVWPLGLAMAGGQIIGATAGSHLAIKHGARLIKPMLISVSLLLSIKLLFFTGIKPI